MKDYNQWLRDYYDKNFEATKRKINSEISLGNAMYTEIIRIIEESKNSEEAASEIMELVHATRYEW